MMGERSIVELVSQGIEKESQGIGNIEHAIGILNDHLRKIYDSLQQEKVKASSMEAQTLIGTVQLQLKELAMELSKESGERVITE